MVSSSQPANRYGSYAGVGKQSSKPPASSVSYRPITSSREQTLTLNRSRNVTLERDDSSVVSKKKYVANRLDSLPPHVLDRVYQVCINNEDTSQITVSETALDPRAARILQIEEEPVQQHVKAPQKASKRKALASTDSSDEENEESWSNHGNMQITLHIANEDEVVHFLKMRFTQIQQLATKVIAKAWIKAICPKKQANFPYVDSNPRPDQSQKRRRPRHDGAPRIPLFWPDVELCRHKEPDHTRKTERTYLLVHLLRLHWTEQDWLASNGSGSEVPQKIKDRNWIGFLKDAFPVNKLEEVQGSNPDKAAMRRRYLNQIYKVAEDEQMMRHRMGPMNQKRSYTAGAGWVPAGTQAAASASQSDRQDSEDEEDSPVLSSTTMARTKSHSEDCVMSPKSEEQADNSESASSYSGVELMKEAKVEQVPFSRYLPADEVAVAGPSHNPDLKFDPADEPMTIPLGSVPPSENMDYYEPSWGGSITMVQRTSETYQQPQYTGTPTPWYGGASINHPQGQLPTVAVSNQLWNEYHHGFGPYQPETLPDRVMNEAVSHNAGFVNIHQMAMSAPFVQPIVTAADEGQHAMYQGSRMHYSHGAFEQHSQPGYMEAAVDDAPCPAKHSDPATVMSFVSGGRGGSSRGRGSSPFGAPAASKTTRPSFAPRARGNNQVRFNAQTRGASERGGRGSFRGSNASRGGGRGRGKTTPAPTPSPFAAPAQAQTPAQSSHASSSSSSSFADRFQALKKRREQERIHAIAQGFLADPDKPRTLAEAITPVGTCPDMCPEFERLERVVQKDVWGPELDDQGAPAEHRMVKKFRRAAAGIDEQLPSDLRPPSTLKETVDYLFNEMVANAESLGSVHHFVWDRTRAIRNDFSIQQITKPADVEIAIECYERIARFHILSLHQLAVPDKPYDKYDWYQEREQLDRTLLSLMQYYDDSRGRVECKNEAEFRAYLIIFQAQDPTPDLDERVNTWPVSVRSDRRVRVALDLNSAASNIVDPQGPLKPRAVYPVAREDWAHFFDLVRSNKVSYLMACVSEIYFKLVRRTALNAIWRGFKGQVVEFTLSLMTRILGFDDPEQTETFCQHFGFVFKASNSGGEDFLDLDSVKGKTFPVEAPGLEHQTFSEDLVEVKRMGRSFSAVIGGYTVAEAQSSGLIDVNYDSQMEDHVEDQAEDSQAEDDPDSLFIPEGPSKPAFGNVAAFTSSPFSSPFALNKPPGEAQPPSLFTQPKPTNSGFGQPSASTGFNFGKPSVNPPSSEAPTSAAASPFNSVFGQQPKSEDLNPFATATPVVTSEVITSTEQPSKSPTSLFSFTKPTINDDQASLKPLPTQSEASGPTNFAKGPSIWGTPAPTAPTATQQTTSIPAPSSIFEAPSTQSQPKPSFSFSSTSQTTAQPPQPPPSSSKSPFSFSSLTSDDSDLSKSTQESVEPTQKPISLFSKPTTFPSEPPTISQAPSPPTTVNEKPEVSVFNASPSSKLPQFNFSQPSQPKKPSPLSQSFSLNDKSESTTTKESSASLFESPVEPVSQTPVAPPPKPAKSKDDILEQLAREVVLDADRGLIRQFVEYHARQTVMGVYDELYMESIRELADTFRRETLSYRYGKRWREICWRRRLARQGRERRKRAKKDQSARELKRKLAAEKDAVDDFLKSTRSTVSLGASLRDPRLSLGSQTDGQEYFEETRDQSTTRDSHGNKRLKSLDIIDLETPKRKQPAATPRSNFLSFSMLGSQNRPAISSTPSRSNYFRLKALGINPVGETNPTPQVKKRLREDSEEAQAQAQPPNKKSQTPPSAVVARPSGAARPLASGSAVTKSISSGLTATVSLSKARQEDEELFARARAARQAMADSSAWYRSEIRKDDTRRNEEAGRSLTSPSMERARELARLRSSRPGAASPDVPAYRLRESRFVPRAQYNLAIEKARQKIESRSRSPSRLSTPRASQSPSRSAGKGLMALSTAKAQTSSLLAPSEGQDTQATDSMAQIAALHKAPEPSAWQYEPTFFAESVEPALSETDIKEHGNNLEDLAQNAMNEYVDLGSDDEAEDLQQGEHSDQSTFEVNDMVDTEAFADDDDDDGDEEEDIEEADDEGEEYVGGYAQKSEDFDDEEVYDEDDPEEEEEEEEGLEDFDEEDGDDDDDELSDMSAINASNNIKAGTGTADDAFELSD
ncbi:hypothetical protein KCU61_g3962, partial [Aureobasidium melanogenum]